MTKPPATLADAPAQPSIPTLPPREGAPAPASAALLFGAAAPDAVPDAATGTPPPAAQPDASPPPPAKPAAASAPAAASPPPAVLTSLRAGRPPVVYPPPGASAADVSARGWLRDVPADVWRLLADDPRFHGLDGEAWWALTTALARAAAERAPSELATWLPERWLEVCAPGVLPDRPAAAPAPPADPEEAWERTVRGALLAGRPPPAPLLSVSPGAILPPDAEVLERYCRQHFLPWLSGRVWQAMAGDPRFAGLSPIEWAQVVFSVAFAYGRRAPLDTFLYSRDDWLNLAAAVITPDPSPCRGRPKKRGKNRRRAHRQKRRGRS